MKEIVLTDEFIRWAKGATYDDVGQRRVEIYQQAILDGETEEDADDRGAWFMFMAGMAKGMEADA